MIDTDALIEKLKPQLLELNDKFESSPSEDEREAIATEGCELIAKEIIKALLEKLLGDLTPEKAAAWAVGEIARFGGHSGGVYTGGSMVGRGEIPAVLSPEFVAPHRSN